MGLVFAGINIASKFGDESVNQFGAYPIAYFIGYVVGAVFIVSMLGLFIGSLIDLGEKTNQDSRPYPQKLHGKSATKINNFIARHWRGEFPLWVAYWVFGFLGNITIATIPYLTAAIFIGDTDFYPPAIFATIVATWVASSIILIWQLIGTWRSASAYIVERTAAGKIALWGNLAHVALALGFLGVGASLLGKGFPQIGEAYNIAFRDDPRIPPYSIRVMRNGTEIELVGGIKYGIADDFEKILNAARSIKVVHLDSAGGRIGEGKKLYELIKERQLTTYVSAKCLSACTLAFAGGRNRYILKGAVLGFHRGAFPGTQEDQFDIIQRKIFVISGFDNNFINKALSTPHKDIWKPTTDVLIKSNVVTAVVDGTKFAISGHGADIDEETISNALSKIPVFNALKSNYPDKFNDIVSQYNDYISVGKTQEETIIAIRNKLTGYILNLIPHADDNVLIEYSVIIADQYYALNKINPSFCYKFASDNTSNSALEKYLPKELIKREQLVQERVIQTAKRRKPLNKAVSDKLWTEFSVILHNKGVSNSDIDLFKSTNLEQSLHSRYCKIAIIFFSEISKLAEHKGALLMREIYSELSM